MKQKNAIPSCLTNVATCLFEVAREPTHMWRVDWFCVGCPIVKKGAVCLLTTVLCLCPSLSFSLGQEENTEAQGDNEFGFRENAEAQRDDGFGFGGEFSNQPERPEEPRRTIPRRTRNLDELRLSGDFSGLPLSDFFAYIRLKLSIAVRADEFKNGHGILVARGDVPGDRYSTRCYHFTETFSRLLESLGEEDLQDLVYSRSLRREYLESIQIGTKGEGRIMVSAHMEVHRKLAGTLTELGILRRGPLPKSRGYVSRRRAGELQEFWNRLLPKKFILENTRIDVALERLEKELEGTEIHVILYEFESGTEEQDDGGGVPAEALP